MSRKDGSAPREGRRAGELADIQKSLIRLSGQRGPQANAEKRENFRKASPRSLPRCWRSKESHLQICSLIASGTGCA
eukprot:scaffold330241_cov46-Prasinocladus_malaysianus.AAC.2